jgi:hypothetical protein
MPDNTTDGMGEVPPDLTPTEEAYVPFEEEPSVGDPVTPGPLLASSEAPQVDEEPPGSMNAEPEQAPEPEPEPLPEFDPRCREEFDGLMFIGALSTTVKFAGHKFEIRTVSDDDTLNIGIVVKPWNDTIAAQRAFALATVAAGLVTIDGKQLPYPITNDPDDTWLRNRFEWCRQNLYPPVTDKLFQEMSLLESQVDGVIDAMGEA